MRCEWIRNATHAVPMGFYHNLLKTAKTLTNTHRNLKGAVSGHGHYVYSPYYPS